MPVQVTRCTGLGRVVRSTRKALGLTQPDLARKAGVGVRFIVELEKGKPTAQVGKALLVLHMLGVAVEFTPPPGVEQFAENREEETA